MSPPQRLRERRQDTLRVAPVPLAAPRRTAAELTSLALLNCLLREVSGPGGHLHLDGARVLITLPVSGRRLRAAVSRPSMAEPRLTGRVEEWNDGAGWLPLSWDRLAHRVDAELAGPQGVSDGQLITEVAASHTFMAETLHRRSTGPVAGADPMSDYLASEQSLIAGHHFHPAPKARSGELSQALAHAPETRSEFRLRWLAVPPELIQQYEQQPGDGRVFHPGDGTIAAGRLLLPVHPWQHRILTSGNAFRAAIETGRLTDLGARGRPVRSTSSVRTVARPDGTGFLKLGLTVQITNCLRVNPPHELQAAVLVSRLLQPIRAELAARFAGTVVLAEPASRTVDLGSGDPDHELATGLGVIAREGLAGRLRAGVRPLLCAALLEPAPDPAVAAVLNPLGAERDRLITWWDRYLDLLLPPVLHAFLAHGVVFEAHPQNAVIGVDHNGMPSQLVLRDLEGVKLVDRRHAPLLAGLAPRVREHLSYSATAGWNRVAYCLFVNHLNGVLATLADHDPGAERLLWARVRTAIQSFRRDHGDAAQLRDLLAGLPLPAKTNLLTRWHRKADRDSSYVSVSLPIGPAPTESGSMRGVRP